MGYPVYYYLIYLLIINRDIQCILYNIFFCFYVNVSVVFCNILFGSFKMIRIDRSVDRRDTNRVSTHIKADGLKIS